MLRHRNMFLVAFIMTTALPLMVFGRTSTCLGVKTTLGYRAS